MVAYNKPKMNIPSVVKARILGTGSYLPERRITNAELSSLVELSEADIVDRTGIHERRWAAKDEAASDLAVRAAEAALKMAGCPVSKVDVIILSTTSPDMPAFPATACLVQERLGAHHAVGFDVAASCGGFLFALSVGQQWLQSGKARVILLIASEIKSRFLNLHDPATAIVFGDGAGAVLLGSGKKGHPVLDLKLYSDGSRSHLIQLPAGGSRQATSHSTLSQGLHYLVMNGGAVYRAAIKKLSAITSEMMERHGLTILDIDHFVYHQANGRILSALAKRLSIPSDRIVRTIGYTV